MDPTCGPLWGSHMSRKGCFQHVYYPLVVQHSWLEKGPFEDVFPMKHGDIPASYVSLPEGSVSVLLNQPAQSCVPFQVISKLAPIFWDLPKKYWFTMDNAGLLWFPFMKISIDYGYPLI